MRKNKITAVFLVLILASAIDIRYCLGVSIDLKKNISVPVFPGAKDTWGGPQPFDINGIPTIAASFVSSGSTDEVLDFYKTQMLKVGWQVGMVWGSLNVMYFKKDSDYLYVACSQTPRGKALALLKFLIVLSQKEIRVCAPETLLIWPKETDGRDLSFIPRYPSSVRVTDVIREEKEAYLIYMSGDDISKILSFYKKKLPAFGWRLIVEQFSPSQLYFWRPLSSVTLSFGRGGKDNLNIYINHCAMANGNVIIISYNNIFSYAPWPLS